MHNILADLKTVSILTNSINDGNDNKKHFDRFWLKEHGTV